MWGNRLRCNGQQLLFLLLSLFISACSYDKNYAPVASAGLNLLGEYKKIIRLDGTDSYDANGDELTYHWEFVEKPAGSEAELIDPISAQPEFMLDAVGKFRLHLIVSDGEMSSEPDFVVVNVINEPPVARITEASVPNGKSYAPGDTIILNGQSSSDIENQTLSYFWDISAKPAASSLALDITSLDIVRFKVDVEGKYIIHLIVSDGVNLSEKDIKIINVEKAVRRTDTRPFAEAGKDQLLLSENTLITLDGSQSYDVENDPLKYQWTMVYKPEISNASLLSPNSVKPEFTADVLGSYVVKLVVSDLNGESHVDSVVITTHDNVGLVCGDCHTKPASHALRFDDCATCHMNERWLQVSTEQHSHGHLAKPAQCDVCHNNELASGKPTKHVETSKDCNFCHFDIDAGWLTVSDTPELPVFDHTGIFAGCISCHDNEFQQGKPEAHMPVSDRCLACHTTLSWFSEVHLEHTTVFKQCDSCHNGVRAKGKKIGHVATTQNCSSCHVKNDWKLQLNPVIDFDHRTTTEPCVSCHNNARGKSRGQQPLHILTSDSCDACHALDIFKPVISIDHHQVVGECVDCHNGFVATGKSASHLPTTNMCEACHSIGRTWVAIVVDHNQKLGACESCHIESKLGNHISTTDDCEKCHVSSYWLPVPFIDHNEVFGTCVSCHDGIDVLGKGQSHILTTDACDYCHVTDRWGPAKSLIPHSQVFGTCEGCHFNSLTPVSVLPESHINYSKACDKCHSTMTWKIPMPTNTNTDIDIDHELQTQNCAICHDGVSATNKSEDHMDTTDICEACHNTDFWVPAKTFDHQNAIGICFKCHDGNSAQGKSDSHILVGDECSGCHSIQSFVPAITLDHTQYIGSCGVCHNNEMAGGQHASHIPTTELCEACHGPEIFVPVKNVNHTQVLGPCAGCHNDFLALGKHASHLPTDDQCENCHSTAPNKWKDVKNSLHYFIDLACEICHAAPISHINIGVVDNCGSCHLVINWTRTSRAVDVP